MRYLKKAGLKIKLLPPPFPPEEDLYCGKCQDKFDTSSKRRACFDLCGHLSCLQCIFKMNEGCVDCNAEKNNQVNLKPPPHRDTSQLNGNEEDVDSEEKKKDDFDEGTPILVLSSVLAKPQENMEDDDDDNIFPEIQRLSLSELPVLDRMPNLERVLTEDEEEKINSEPIVITLEDDEEDEEVNVVELEVNKEEVVEDDDIQEVPVEEYTKLAGEDEEDGRNEEGKGYKVELQFCTEEEDDSEIDVKPNIVRENVRKIGRRKMENMQWKKESVREAIAENVKKGERRKRNIEKIDAKVAPEIDNSSVSRRNFNCKYCKLKFPSKLLLGQHLFQKHSDLRPFPCDICHWPFHTKRGLLNHKITHTDERPFECDHCGATFNRKFSLVNHLKKIHDIISSKKRRKELKLNKEDNQLVKIDEESEENFTVPQIVGEPYSMAGISTTTTNLEFGPEFKKLVQEEEQLEEQSCSPLLSPVSLSDKENTKDVSNSDGKPVKRLFFRRKLGVNLPGKKSKKNKVISQHRCHICKETFLGKSKLAIHLRRKHSEERPYSCEICGWSFAQKTKLKIHLITHTIDRPHKCTKCQASFNRKYSLERHVRIMHLKQPRKSESSENKPCQKKSARCPYEQECEMGEFETRQILAVHLKEEHGDRRPFVCEICEFPFQRKKNLKAHMKSHSDDKPFECRLCVNKYNRLFSLERHMENCHGVRIRLFENEYKETGEEDEYCVECQSAFGSSENCYKVAYSECGHIICMECVVKADGFGCGQCTTENAKMDWETTTPKNGQVKIKENMELFKKLVDRLNLEEMERNKLLKVEVKLKRLEDMELGEWYSKKVTEVVVKSLKGHDWVDVEKEKNEENVKMIIRRNGRKICECPYCKKGFNEKKKLGEHLNEKHGDLRPFPCDTCGWPFSSAKDLERHKLIHTNEKPFKCNLCTVVFNRKSTRDRHVEKVHLKWKRI